MGVVWQMHLNRFSHHDHVRGIILTPRAGVHHLPYAQSRLQPILILELFPRLVQRAEHRRADHLLLRRRILWNLRLNALAFTPTPTSHAP